MPNTPPIEDYAADQPRIAADYSDATSSFNRFKALARNVAWQEAFTPLLCGPFETRKLLDPFFRKLDFVSDNIYDLCAKPDHLVQELKDVFSDVMESLVRADWQKLGARGADWNSLCSAVYTNVQQLANVFGLEREVCPFMDRWFAFYRQHGTSLNLQRERRQELNKEALQLHMGSSYARIAQSGVQNVEQTVEANRQRLAAIHQELKAMGDDPDPERNGVFTRAYHRAKGNPIHEPKIIIQDRPHAQPQPKFVPRVPKLYEDVQLEGCSPWEETKRYKLPPKKGLFQRAVSRVAGWFRR